MKKLLLSLGSIAAVVTPVVAVVSCGKKETPATTMTADQFYKTTVLLRTGATVKNAQANVTLSAAITKASIVGKGSTQAIFKSGVYTSNNKAAVEADIHAPQTIEAIAQANVSSGIAGTGHYSLLIGLVKADAELAAHEALEVHKAFVAAYNSAKFTPTTVKLNDLDAKVLYTELAKLSFAAKLNLATKFVL